MKRLLILLCGILLVGCTNVSQSEYQKVVSENQMLTEQVAELTDKLSSYDEIVEYYNNYRAEKGAGMETFYMSAGYRFSFEVTAEIVNEDGSSRLMK